MFELRKLESRDVFVLLRIFKKIGIRKIKESLSEDTIQKMIQSFSPKKKDEEIDEEELERQQLEFGFQLMIETFDIIVENILKIEDDIFEWVADLAGMTVNELKEEDFDVFTDMIFAVISKAEFKDFFKRASKLYNKTNQE